MVTRVSLLVTAVVLAAIENAGCGDPKLISPARADAGGAGPGSGSLPPLAELPDSGFGLGNGATLDGADNGAAGNDAGAPPTQMSVLVYAQSGSDLFKVEPETLEVTRIGPFVEALPGGAMKFLNDVTDIAVDRRGRIIGTTYDRLLDIDATTATCRFIAMLPAGKFNGLSWVRTEAGEEVLMATGLDSSVFRIDATTGTATQVGSLGPGLVSSGDLVSVASYGTLITLKGATSDVLARMDPATGQATVIGPTGFSKVWGIGFWGNRVFGFTSTGEFLLIDPKTGVGNIKQKFSAYPFWGAGVTTSVPVID